MRESEGSMAGDEMQGKICLITGATRGIGKATAVGLARLGATVVIVARDPGRGAATVIDVEAHSDNSNVHLLVADLASQAQIRRLADDFTQKYERLDVLVNNAGAVNKTRRLSQDGIELTFAVNHLAYFLLTDLLLPVLERSAPSRIVNVASDAERGGTMRFDDLQRERGYRGTEAYAQSKLANLLFTYELARRLQGTGVTVNAMHPGTVATGFGKNEPGLMSLGMRLIAPLLRKPDKGAETVIYLASSPDVQGVSGAYFYDCRQKQSSPASYDTESTRRLWDVSAAMTGLAG